MQGECTVAIRTYRDLQVWQRAMDMVVQAYQVAKAFPSVEKFGLTAQLQRAAVSVPANIAEGHGRTYRGDYLRHLSIARGSLAEVETHLTLAVRLELITREQAVDAWRLCQDVGKLLNKLIRSLERGRKDSSLTPDP
ncbi:MAG: four helix bundle protein [Phycisphaerae bacterium]|nr:four helix bundle protein [Phycisphaerae bacterium]